ncbi:hypothetical protein JHK82_036169 [Glycine max]|nr:hypothetical protein JHK82_036169 [Glycine max]
MPNPAEHVDLARVVTPRDDSHSGEDHPFPGHLLYYGIIPLQNNAISEPHIPPTCSFHGNEFLIDGGVSEGHVVFLAVVLPFMGKLGLEREMVYAMFRAFLQLSIIGFVLQFIFNQGNVG